jgi:methyl-accepting chemotaxis protein
MPSLNLHIRGRLILGFGILCLLLGGAVTTTIIKVRTINEATARNVNLRMPTAMSAGDLVSGVYASLAALHGWLLTGNEAFKAERAGLWKRIQLGTSDMDHLASQWTNPNHKMDWKQAKPLLDELRGAQDKAEAIAYTMDEQPAAKILAMEAAPLAKVMLQRATAIINQEGSIPSTDSRKSPSNVTGVRQAAGDTGAAAQQVLQASSELSQQSEMMRGQVEAFLRNIKAA